MSILSGALIRSVMARLENYASMDGYALRSVKALLNKVGVIEFNRLLDLFGIITRPSPSNGGPCAVGQPSTK